jgi:hypothetical protein
LTTETLGSKLPCLERKGIVPFSKKMVDNFSVYTNACLSLSPDAVEECMMDEEVVHQHGTTTVSSTNYYCFYYSFITRMAHTTTSFCGTT